MSTPPLEITWDAAHSQDEERWFTLGTSSDGKLLAVAHTHQQAQTDTQARIRIISARPDPEAATAGRVMEMLETVLTQASR